MDGTRDLPVDLEDALRRAHQRVEIHVEKRRFGKDVTVLSGFSDDVDLGVLARTLKRRLATGGSAKENRIELQGNQAPRLPAILDELGLGTLWPRRGKANRVGAGAQAALSSYRTKNAG